MKLSGKLHLLFFIIAAISFSIPTAQAATTPTLSFPPQDIGIGPTGWNWSYFNGAKSGFSLTATSSFSFNRLTMWECVNNGVQVVYAHVYKGELDHLEEIATSSPFTFTNSCPPDINQRTYLLSTDGYKDTYVFDQQIPVTPGERITILFEPIVGYPYGGYIQFGARPARDITDFVGRVGTSSVTTSPTDINSLYPYYPAFELGNETAECTPGTAGCNSNVLFLPGIESSRLYVPLACDAGVCEKQLWEPDGDALAGQLANDTSGTSINPSIYTKPNDIIDNAYFIAKGNVYKSFIEDMNAIVASGTIRRWEAVPYDWRLSPDQILSSGKLVGGNKISYLIATSSPYIIQELKNLAHDSKSKKVTIIAHSNGGLVLKRLTEILGPDAATLIDKIIFVASPQAGTPQAIGAILHGDNQGLPFDAFPYKFSNKAARNLSLNMPMSYNLLPSPSYFTYVDDPVITIDDTLPQWQVKYGNKIHSSSQLRNFLTDTSRTKPAYDDLVTPEIGNTNLFDQAAVLHDTQLDHWTPPSGVQLIQIAGWGIPTTMKGVDYSTGKKCTRVDSVVIQGRTSYYCGQYSPVLTFTASTTVDGDGTVVVPSALWTSASTGVTNYWVDLSKYSNDHWASSFGGSTGLAPFKHANILEVNELRSFLTDMLASSTKPLSAYTYLSTEAPLKLNHRLLYSLHSPLSLNLYDNEGRHTGISTTTGEVEEQIPGTYYTEFGDVKYVFTEASSSVHIVMNGYATGTFTFNIDEFQGNALLASTTFKDVPTTSNTKVTLDVQSGVTTVSPMSVDVNGDGSADITLTPTLNAIVTSPQPKIPLTVTADNKTITIGSPIPSFTTTLSGFQNTDTATSSTSGGASCTTIATASSSVGSYPIICTKGTLASNKYDFTTFASGTLTILYKWTGFLQPINDVAYNPTQSMSVFKGGSTIPVKFQLKNTSGTAIQVSTLPLWLAPQRGSAMSAAVDESTYSDPATSGVTFKWDTTSQQYIYNWSTKGLLAGYWYKIYAKLEDGTVQTVTLGIR